MPSISNFESTPSRWLRKLSNSMLRYQSHTKVLLYHRVCDLSSDPLQLSVTPETFYQQLAWVKKNYGIISVDELAEAMIKGKKIKGKTVLISFDDGYADNLLQALPVLETLNIPAIFFITTSHLDTSKEMWWDELERLTLKNNALPPKLFFNNLIAGKEENVLSGGDADALFASLHDDLKYSTFSKREIILDSLRRQTDPKPYANETHRMMKHAELKKLASSSLVHIGAHTVNHVCLGIQEIAEQQHEMSKCREILEQLTGKPVHYLAYPYGSTKDFSDTTAKLAAEAGFKLSFANYFGYVSVNTPHHKIPRILVRNWNITELNRQINQLY